jgi:predicted aldo/keto reductase-like oxidoreductase
METRTIKKLGKTLSLLGVGGMRFPQKDEKIDTIKAQEIVDYAYQNGVNYFDTAWFYHGGESEIFFGNALKKYDRKSFYLADKLPIWECETPEDMKILFDTQLERCQTDYFDFYLHHNLDKGNFAKVVEFGAFEFIQKMKDEGKIKHIGFSFHDDTEHFKKVLDAFDWEFVQLQINYFDWDIYKAKELYELSVEKELPVIIMEPVRGGMLANMSKEIFEAEDSNSSVASWAIRYVATLDNVVTVLSGMSTLEQVIDNVKTLSSFKSLSKMEYEVIDKAIDFHKRKDTIPCTSCNYCEGCPAGLEIPKIFELYNIYKMEDNWWNYKVNYWDKFEAENKADKCLECGECMTHCPQSLNIIELLKKVDEKTTEIFVNNT